MEELIFGFLLAILGVPLFQTATLLLDMLTELAKAKISVSIAKYNREMASIIEDEEPIQETQIIGFQAPSTEEELDEY